MCAFVLQAFGLDYLLSLFANTRLIDIAGVYYFLTVEDKKKESSSLSLVLVVYVSCVPLCFMISTQYSRVEYSRDLLIVVLRVVGWFRPRHLRRPKCVDDYTPSLTLPNFGPNSLLIDDVTS